MYDTQGRPPPLSPLLPLLLLDRLLFLLHPQNKPKSGYTIIHTPKHTHTHFHSSQKYIKTKKNNKLNANHQQLPTTIYHHGHPKGPRQPTDSHKR